MERNDIAPESSRPSAPGARENLADVGPSVRERTGHVKDSLADALETGAEKLRQRAGAPTGQLAVPAQGASVAIAHDGRVATVTNKVAVGMDRTAGWLRQTDLDSVKNGIERQVKEHPGRSLLVAAGVGYLIGKAFKK